MLCPVCKTALVISERQGIEIDYCQQCRGVWLDRSELDRIIERSATAYASTPEPRREYDERKHYERPHYADHKKHYRKKSLLGELFDF